MVHYIIPLLDGLELFECAVPTKTLFFFCFFLPFFFCARARAYLVAVMDAEDPPQARFAQLSKTLVMKLDTHHRHPWV